MEGQEKALGPGTFVEPLSAAAQCFLCLSTQNPGGFRNCGGPHSPPKRRLAPGRLWGHRGHLIPGSWKRGSSPAALPQRPGPAPFSSPGSWWGWQMNNRREAIPQKNKHNSKGSTDGSTRTGVPLGDIRPGLQNARLDESQAGIKTAMRNINNFRYADDTTLTAESEKELKSLLMKVKEETGKSWLKTQHSENSDHGI